MCVCMCESYGCEGLVHWEFVGGDVGRGEVGWRIVLHDGVHGDVVRVVVGIGCRLIQNLGDEGGILRAVGEEVVGWIGPVDGGWDAREG